MRHGKPAASLRLFFDTLACSARPPFDIIHCHFGPNGLRGLKLREIGALDGKLVVSFYGYDVSEFPRQRGPNCYSQLFQQADVILPLSEHMRGQLMNLGCAKSKTVLHPLGIRSELFANLRRDSNAARSVRILTIARLVEKKGIKYGLHAVASLAQEGARIQYDIIGEGPLRPELEQMINELRLQEIVHLMGPKPRSEVIQALETAAVLLAPSVTADRGDQEGTPVVIMEALAAGLPVVSTLHAGIPEVVQEGVSGFLVPERDVASLTTALRRLLTDPLLRAQMGDCGRAFISERHDVGKLNKRLMDVYRQLSFLPPRSTSSGTSTKTGPGLAGESRR
jgi:colanic acid/amylovoran biosynthesis glycosyltransferase